MPSQQHPIVAHPQIPKAESRNSAKTHKSLQHQFQSTVLLLIRKTKQNGEITTTCKPFSFNSMKTISFKPLVSSIQSCHANRMQIQHCQS